VKRSGHHPKEAEFEGELLPAWSQLLDVAARMVPIGEALREWFARFGRGAGVDDSRTVLGHCEALKAALLIHREQIVTELRNQPDEGQAVKIWEAWAYSLDTMIQRASASKTCQWRSVGGESEATQLFDDGGEIDLRRP
jgi:hypothetical protein